MSGHQEAVECVRRLQAGDKRALAELHDRYAPLLLSVALRILKNAPDAEDVMQQTLIQVWRSAHRYDASRGSVTTWLLNLVRSRAIDRGRSLASRRRAEASANPAPAPVAPPETMEARQRRERVRAALDGLEQKQRQVLELAYFEGLAQSEIAARLETPLGTVKSWTRRGLLALRQAMGGRS